MTGTPRAWGVIVYRFILERRAEGVPNSLCPLFPEAWWWLLYRECILFRAFISIVNRRLHHAANSWGPRYILLGCAMAGIHTVVRPISCPGTINRESRMG